MTPILSNDFFTDRLIFENDSQELFEAFGRYNNKVFFETDSARHVLQLEHALESFAQTLLSSSQVPNYLLTHL